MNKNNYITEYRGRTIINHRGNKDYLRVKKERIPRRDGLTTIYNESNVSYRMSINLNVDYHK